MKYDNAKRGVYVPNSLKSEQSPVNTRGVRKSPYLEPLQPAPTNALQPAVRSSPVRVANNRPRPANNTNDNVAGNRGVNVLRNIERTVPRVARQQPPRANNGGHKARIG